MRIQTSKSEATLPQAQALSEVLPTQGLSYHEMADIPVQEVNLFEQLEQNLAQVSDLQKRMSFVMREIRYLMKL
jgi:hypothetical protein